MKYSTDETLVDWIASQWDKITWTYNYAKELKEKERKSNEQ